MPNLAITSRRLHSGVPAIGPTRFALFAQEVTDYRRPCACHNLKPRCFRAGLFWLLNSGR